MPPNQIRAFILKRVRTPNAISNIEMGWRGDGRNLSPSIVQRAFIFQTPDAYISVFGVVGASNTSVFSVFAGACLVVSV